MTEKSLILNENHFGTLVMEVKAAAIRRSEAHPGAPGWTDGALAEQWGLLPPHYP